MNPSPVPWFYYLAAGIAMGTGIERLAPGGPLPWYFWICGGLVLIFVAFAVYDQGEEDDARRN